MSKEKVNEKLEACLRDKEIDLSEANLTQKVWY